MEHFLVIRECGETAFPDPRVSSILNEDGSFVSWSTMSETESYPQDITEYVENINFKDYNAILIPLGLKLEVMQEDDFIDADTMEEIVPWNLLKGIQLFRRLSPA